MYLTKLKPFDLERAKAGAKVVTRVGQEAKIFSFNSDPEGYEIVGRVTEFRLHAWNFEGKFLNDRCSSLDLFMAPVKREGWVNIYRLPDYVGASAMVIVGNAWETKEEAENLGINHETYITTVKIEWEE